MPDTILSWNDLTPGVSRHCWIQPAAASGYLNTWCYRCVETAVNQPWDRDVAPRLLHPAEMKVWWCQPSDAARRRWLRGRLAAKDAVRRVILKRTREAVAMGTLAILPGPLGQPRVSGVARIPPSLHVSVSIAHCGALSAAIAAIAPRGSEIGLDIASRTDNHEGLAEGGFAASEIALLPEAPPWERNRRLLQMWCAKEAAGKALGTGLHGDPLNFIVVKNDASRNSILVEPRFAMPSDSDARLPPMSAAVGGDDTLVFAVATGERLP